MASARLFALLGPSFLRNSRKSAQISPKFDIFCFNPSTRFRCSYSAAFSLDSVASNLATGDSPAAPAHPWPEWIKFVDSLKAKGYLTQKAAASEDGDSGSNNAGASVYNDMKLVKDACLSFGRDRFDIFKSLSTQDIQTVVEKGCPTLYRKAVNSSKRLRAYLKIDEAAVCEPCNFVRSCDRAFCLLKDGEGDARTVDVVRILLICALQSATVFGENKLAEREIIESSARKLLSELIELGDTPRDPNIQAPPSTPQRKKSSRSSDGENPKYVFVTSNDWPCSKCKFVNFARNVRCLQCQAERPISIGDNSPEKKKGDWDCPKCNFMNFAKNTKCLNCKTERPANERKKGDWDCPRCTFFNYAKNQQCYKCEEPRPQRELRPGDWECPKCDFLNFGRNTICKRCNFDRPTPSVLDNNDDHLWKKPY
ncbi:zinc finger protein VAR3, chloroplastic [Andrographis paniculata]|uniref:zinc finger protein VAR3, chloroplastic n=1 Tax=Andrographis paniculata TaxID=175694 RepID=UPI0021E78D3D|nr:zinc finger protein VAR3, chloroplastic [Andrographis paniculata]